MWSLSLPLIAALLLLSSAVSHVASQNTSTVDTGIIYDTPTGNNSNTNGSAVYPIPDTIFASDTNITGDIPSDFQAPVLIQDNGTTGPPIEIVHYYYDQWPIGLAVVPEDSQVLVCYTRGTYNYTLGRTTNITAEEPYPSQDDQLLADEICDYSVSNITGFPFGSNDSTKLINVQALYQSPNGSLWVLDTGRPTITNNDGNSVIAYAQVGGPKLIRMSSNGTFERTYTFPYNVHYPDSSMNDVRFDMRTNSTPSGEGIAYIVDASLEGRNGFIVLDLGTGKSWRRLSGHPSTLTVYQNRPTYFGQPFYETTKGQSQDFLLEGFDGLALSSDGEYAYYSPLTSDYLYRVPTSYLRVCDDDAGISPQKAERDAANHVENLGQKGSQTNGFDSDTNGIIYMSAPEINGILSYNPQTGLVSTFIRDPRLFWIDSIVIASDGYLYGNVNQLPNQDTWQNGTDLRSKPGFMFRVQLPNGGTRLTDTLMG